MPLHPWAEGRDSAGDPQLGEGQGSRLLTLSLPRRSVSLPEELLSESFQRSHYEGFLAVSGESVPGSSRGLVVNTVLLLSKRVLHSLALKMQATFAGQLIEVIML